MNEKEMAKRYVQAGGVKCPFCDSVDIEGGAVEIDFGRAYQKVTCKKCGHDWSDGYSLNSIMLTDEFVHVTEAGADEKAKRAPKRRGKRGKK